MRCYLDLDGVLGDFEAHCRTLFGKNPKELGDETLWKLVNEDREGFWSNIPLKDGAMELFAIAEPYNPTILTGCPRNGDIRTEICPVASDHKKLWVEKYFGEHVPVITCFSKHKADHMYQAKDILVDDTYINIKRWREAGGIGIIYKDVDQAIRDLKQKLI